MDNTTLSDIKEALLRSGYLLENRVLSFFLENEFNAESNHTFFLSKEDSTYREIDVIAKKFLYSHYIGDSDESIDLTIKFAVECINNPVPLALFKNNYDLDEPATDWATSIINGSADLIELCSLEWTNSVNKYESTIFESLPSRQYCSFIKKKDRNKNEWMACHPNDFHNTLNKLSLYTKYSIQENSNRWSDVRPQRCRLDMVIPLIVLQGEMFEIIQDKDIKITPMEYYRLKTPHEQKYNNNLSIDIVTEKFLQEYLTKKLLGISQMFEDLKIKVKEFYPYK